MKKSIAILSAVVILSLATSMKDHECSLPTTGNFVATRLLHDPVPVVSFSCFKAEEGQNPPWKDPWQWFQIFRDLLSF